MPSLQSSTEEEKLSASTDGAKMPALFMNVNHEKDPLKIDKDPTTEFFENVQNPFAPPAVPSAVPHAPAGEPLDTADAAGGNVFSVIQSESGENGIMATGSPIVLFFNSHTLPRFN